LNKILFFLDYAAWHNHCLSYFIDSSNDYRSRNSDGHLKDKQSGRTRGSSGDFFKPKQGWAFVFARVVDNFRVFGEKVGLLGRTFGCWHEEASRPFSHEKIAYRSFIECGAIKQFDSKMLKTFRAFYFPPIDRSGENILDF